MDTGAEIWLMALILSLDESSWGDHTVLVNYVFHLISICKFNDRSYHHKPQLYGQPWAQTTTTTRLSANLTYPSTSLWVVTITEINLFVCELPQNSVVTGGT